MAITLTYDGTALDLSERLHWSDEFDWQPVVQTGQYSVTGALLLSSAARLAGRPITLDGTQTAAWMPRPVCDTLRTWAGVPGAEFDLLLRGSTRRVVWDHERGALRAQPLWRLLDGEVDAQLVYLPILRFLEI